MTIKDLKEIIKDLPDDCKIGVKDWFGDLIEVDKGDFKYCPIEDDWPKINRIEFFPIPIIDIGECPD